MSKNKNSPLGRGLSSLLGEKQDLSHLVATNQKHKIKNLPIELVSPGPWQTRKDFKNEDLINLSKSIKRNGLIQPIIVSSDKNNEGKFLIVAGERRWRASQLAKLHEIPAIINNDLNETKLMEVSLLENLQRTDLNPIEEGNGFKRLIENYNYSQDEVGKVVGKSRPYITNILRLLTLPLKVQEYLIQEKLSIGHARVLIGNENAIVLAQEIFKKKLSVRQTEKIIKKNVKKDSFKTQDTQNLEHLLSEKTGLKVTLKFSEKTKKGTISFAYENLEQFDHFIDKIKSF